MTLLRTAAALAFLALALSACSKCDAAGWLKSCGASNAPKALVF